MSCNECGKQIKSILAVEILIQFQIQKPNYIFLMQTLVHFELHLGLNAQALHGFVRVDGLLDL